MMGDASVVMDLDLSEKKLVTKLWTIESVWKMVLAAVACDDSKLLLLDTVCWQGVQRIRCPGCIVTVVCVMSLW